MVKLAIIECIEATGNIALPFFVKLGHELEEVTQQKCRYFSEYHLQVETGHIQSGLNYEQTDEFLKNLQITEEQNAKALKAVEIVFDSFSACLNEMMECAEVSSDKQKLENTKKLDTMQTVAKQTEHIIES